MLYEVITRILDFVGGAVYSLNGDIKKVARSIFVVAPSNVDVAQSVDDRGSREGFKRFDWFWYKEDNDMPQELLWHVVYSCGFTGYIKHVACEERGNISCL